jgi:two-component system NarL family response regulator
LAADHAPSRIRILVVEDNELFRLGTTSLIATQPDLEVVAEAHHGAEALSLYDRTNPDVVVVDLRMPHLDGVQVTAALARRAPPGRVLVLTHYQGGEDVARALRAGALGYLGKDTSGEEVLRAIRTVAGGKRYLPPEIADRLAENLQHAPLTAREQQVLACLFDGMSNREVATALGIAERSATTYVSQLLGKLGAKSRTEAVTIALKRGLLPGR